MGEQLHPEPVLASRPADLVDALRVVAIRAGAAILRIYENGFTVRHKEDASPVTEADQVAETLILAALGELAPGVPVVAEEEMEAGREPRVDAGPFFLVDPLDGTKEFVARTGEFTVNIALVERGHPVVGVIHVPVLGETYWTGGVADGAWRRRGDGPAEPIACRPTPSPEGLDIVASRSHRDGRLESFLATRRVRSLINAGSSLKFCRIAEGAADLYPRFGTTMEWDTAAGHAILAAAGGSVTTVDGAPLGYGKPDFRNPAFIARGPGVE